MENKNLVHNCSKILALSSTKMNHMCSIHNNSWIILQHESASELNQDFCPSLKKKENDVKNSVYLSAFHFIEKYTFPIANSTIFYKKCNFA